MGTRVVSVRNRTNKDYEFMYDGQVYIVPALSEEVLVDHVAAHGIRKSVIKYYPSTNETVRALVLADSPDAKYDIDGREIGSELIERDPADGDVIVKKFSNPDLRGSRISSSLDGE